nr:MAG TPA: hypothetical protein [Bacteriophage sp.]
MSVTLSASVSPFSLICVIFIFLLLIFNESKCLLLVSKVRIRYL